MIDSETSEKDYLCLVFVTVYTIFLSKVTIRAGSAAAQLGHVGGKSLGSPISIAWLLSHASSHRILDPRIQLGTRASASVAALSFPPCPSCLHYSHVAPTQFRRHGVPRIHLAHSAGLQPRAGAGLLGSPKIAAPTAFFPSFFFISFFIQ